MVPSLSVPFAVNVSENGVVPVVARSAVKLPQTGGWLVDDEPLPGVGEIVGVGERGGVGTSVGAAEGAVVGTGVGDSETITVGVGVPEGIDDEPPMVIVAGVALERTFSDA